MTSLLASLIDRCEFGLDEPATAVFDPVAPRCPRCQARGVSVITRRNRFVMCLVCGVSSLRLEPLGSAFRPALRLLSLSAS